MRKVNEMKHRYICPDCYLHVDGKGMSSHSGSQRCKDLIVAGKAGYKHGYKDGQTDIRGELKEILGIKEEK